MNNGKPVKGGYKRQWKEKLRIAAHEAGNLDKCSMVQKNGGRWSACREESKNSICKYILSRAWGISGSGVKHVHAARLARELIADGSSGERAALPVKIPYRDLYMPVRPERKSRAEFLSEDVSYMSAVNFFQTDYAVVAVEHVMQAKNVMRRNRRKYFVTAR